MAATREHRVCKGVGTSPAFRFSVRGDFLMSSQVEFGDLPVSTSWGLRKPRRNEEARGVQIPRVVWRSGAGGGW